MDTLRAEEDTTTGHLPAQTEDCFKLSTLESVKRGTTTAGLKFRDGVVLVCDKRIASRLIIPESIEKMFKSDNVGIATSGLVADARQLVARARVEAQINKAVFATTVPVDILTKKICDFKQSFTQYGGSRPFGTHYSSAE